MSQKTLKRSVKLRGTAESGHHSLCVRQTKQWSFEPLLMYEYLFKETVHIFFLLTCSTMYPSRFLNLSYQQFREGTIFIPLNHTNQQHHRAEQGKHPHMDERLPNKAS